MHPARSHANLTGTKETRTSDTCTPQKTFPLSTNKNRDSPSAVSLRLIVHKTYAAHKIPIRDDLYIFANIFLRLDGSFVWSVVLYVRPFLPLSSFWCSNGKGKG